MIIRKAAILTCILLLPLSALAGEAARIYTIKKGDTLWGISERFLADPYYWPNLWSHNPKVGNPHLIYPGQQIAVVDGRIEFLPVSGEVPAAAPLSVQEAEPLARDSITIKALGAGNGFISSDELGATGTLIDTVDNRIMIGTGDKVFLKMGDLAGTRSGDIFSLFDIGRPVEHPLSGELVGYQVAELGTLQVVETSPSVATAVVTSALREIQRGARIRPYSPPRLEISLKKAAMPLQGTLVSALNGQLALGQYDVIYLDLGSRDGLEVGNLLYISRPRQATELALQGDEIVLPDILLGSAVVTETFGSTATALVLKSADALFRGDRVFTVPE
ncbi:peptidoglycan-binding protein LysM [Desulfuromonas versatilis]|uniref:Peptidoglycan-binding protein LysM n=1 Tax=Desulfuromonas versatilis TaxID=2802975 RepID=A0ABM8HWH5_9BACT|nr:LysM domain-containing protein [Desulfuromonas versatilis]BCR06361.1 peptidoglycan-binding protein LysM [Desulfuromonas versatilis]